MRSVLCGDLGGTKCRFALVTEDRAVHSVRRFATVMDRAAFLDNLNTCIADVLAAAPDGVEAPAALGIGTAGVVAHAGRGLAEAPNVPLGGYDLAGHCERDFGLPTTVLNDGRASAIGEYRFGHAKGRDPLLVLFFGTGIGIGVIADGRPFAGANNAAGEIGHAPHVPHGRIGPHALPGSFEAYCGGGPMTARARDEIAPEPPGGGRWRIDDIVALAGENPVARRILTEAEDAACSLVAMLATLLDPAAVVLGGGVLQGWPALRETIATRAREWAGIVYPREIEFVPSIGESDSILWGAAAITGALWD